MAKVTGPLLSTDARGNIKKTITYSFKRGQNIVKFFKASEDTHTHAQTLQRGLYSEAVSEWKKLTDEEKKYYDRYIRDNILTGYNAFIKQYILNNSISQYYMFGWLISIYYSIGVLLQGYAYREEYLINSLMSE